MRKKRIIQFCILLAISAWTCSYGQSHWEWRNPLPQGNTLNCVIGNQNQIVAVGNFGTVVTSTDGIAWSYHRTGDTNKLNGVTWNGNLYVAVGNNGSIFTSQNGVTWTASISGTKNTLFSVTWTNSNFVAVGAGIVLVSSDGITWISQSLGFNYTLKSIVWADTQCVAVGYGGAILTSPNGSTWTKINSGIRDELNSITWTDSQFVAVGTDGTIITSVNAKTWTRRTSAETDDWYSVAWTGTQLVAVGFASSTYTSPNGITWTNQTQNSGHILYSVTWTGKMAVQVGDGGVIRTSTGMVWTPVHKEATEALSSLTWTGRQLVGIDFYGMVYTSTDGLSWTLNKTNNPLFLYSITWTDSLLIAVGDWDGIYTSPNATGWTRRYPPTAKDLHNVTWTGNKVVVVGDSGVICTSPDGITWQSKNSGTINKLNDVIWTGKQLMAVGAEATIITSIDGESWTSQATGLSGSEELASVAWNGIIYVAVGGKSRVTTLLTSTDGSNWTQRDVTTGAMLSEVAWVTNKFVAVDAYSTIITSPDGITWTKLNSITGNGLVYVRDFGNLLLATGIHGTIISSQLDNVIDAPGLVSPGIDEIDKPILHIPLSWTKVSNAKTYHLQVSTNSLFSGIVVEDSTITDTSWVVDTLANFVKYYWRVRAKCAEGVSAWTPFRMFRTIPPPPPTPVIKYPPDNSLSVQLPCTFRWNVGRTAYRYHVQISRDSNFVSFVIDDSTVTDSQLVAKSLSYTTGYFWRIRAINSAGNSAWSRSYQFTTSISPPKTSPVIVQPFRGESNLPYSIRIVWKKTPAAENYHMVIATDNNYSKKILEDSLLSDTTLAVSGLAQGTTYYLRIRATNAGGSSFWLFDWYFSTIALPVAPIQLFPFDGFGELPDSLPMIWTMGKNVLAHQIQISTDTGFTSLFMQDSLLTDTLLIVHGLARSTTYYWRVRAKNAGGWGNYSARWRFTTSATVDCSKKAGIYSFKVDYPTNRIQYTIPEVCYVNVKYFNLNGKTIGSFINQTQQPGSYSFAVPVANFGMGTYIQLFTAGKIIRKRKMVILNH